MHNLFEECFSLASLKKDHYARHALQLVISVIVDRSIFQRDKNFFKANIFYQDYLPSTTSGPLFSLVRAYLDSSLNTSYVTCL